MLCFYRSSQPTRAGRHGSCRCDQTAEARLRTHYSLYTRFGFSRPISPDRVPALPVFQKISPFGDIFYFCLFLTAVGIEGLLRGEDVFDDASFPVFASEKTRSPKQFFDADYQLPPPPPPPPPPEPPPENPEPPDPADEGAEYPDEATVFIVPKSLTIEAAQNADDG